MRALLAALALAAAMPACQKEKDETAPTAVVERGNLKVLVMTTGTVKPQNRIEMKSPIAGRVEEILVEEGAAVRKGQIMAWLSSTDRAALLDAARSKGDETLNRWETLFRPTPLITPIDATVIFRAVQPGQTVGVSDAILVLSDRLIVQGQVDETDIGRLRLGQIVAITLDAYPAQTSTGRVNQIAFEAKTINNVTMYKVDVLPDRVPDFFRSGMTASLTYIVAETNGVLLLPNEALILEKKRTCVRRASPEKREAQALTPVETGLSDGKKTELRSGLREGDAVALPGLSSGPAQDKPKASNPFMPFTRPRGRR